MENKPDVVISTRIRLARNLKDYPFLGKITSEKQKEICEKVTAAIKPDKNYDILKLENISEITARSLVEKHIVSPEFIGNRVNRLLIADKAGETAIMVNEEDHLRIQCMKKGYCFEEMLSKAFAIDTMLDKKLKFAFDEELGYLTYCPTNLGTGLRASVMLHLPAVAMSGFLTALLNTIGKLGMTVRGIYGEGSQSYGNLYQLSNQTTLGLSEQEIVERISDVSDKIINQESQTREKIRRTDSAVMEDKIFRSLGILQNSRILSYQELLSLYSDVRLGISLGIIDNITFEKLDNILDNTGAATISQNEPEEIPAAKRDILRAKIVGEALKL